MLSALSLSALLDPLMTTTSPKKFHVAPGAVATKSMKNRRDSPPVRTQDWRLLWKHSARYLRSNILVSFLNVYINLWGKCRWRGLVGGVQSNNVGMVFCHKKKYDFLYKELRLTRGGHLAHQSLHYYDQPMVVCPCSLLFIHWLSSKYGSYPIIKVFGMIQTGNEPLTSQAWGKHSNYDTTKSGTMHVINIAKGQLHVIHKK